MTDIPRRAFLKTAPAAAGGLALARRLSAEAQPSGTVRISSVTYRPVRDYPIVATRHSDVTLRDAFWKPKVALNAAVTIPSYVRSVTERGRTLNGNVLEAAILSLQTHPDPALQAQVESRITAMKGTRATGNNTFEVAATYYAATGKRDLLDNAIAAATTSPTSRCSISATRSVTRSTACR